MCCEVALQQSTLSTLSIFQNVGKNGISSEDFRFTKCVSHTFNLCCLSSKPGKMMRRYREYPGLLLVAHGQLVATFCPTPGENFSSVFGRHARSESVGVFAFSCMRLVCSFHYWSPNRFQTKKGCLIFRQSFFAVNRRNFKQNMKNALDKQELFPARKYRLTNLIFVLYNLACERGKKLCE